MNKFVKLLILIVVFILIILSILFIVKFYRVNKIIELMKKNSKIDNYKLEDSDLIRNRYKNIILITPTNDSNLCYYYDFDIDKCYIIDKMSKIYFENNIEESDKDLLNFPLYNYLTDDYSFKNKIKLIFLWKIRKYDDSKFEIITERKDKVIFDKETGLVLNVNDIKSCNIAINKVETVEFPKISEYNRQN